LAPFHLVIVEIDAHKSPQVSEVSEAIYEAMEQAGIEVLLDDRDRKTSPGVKFADSELIGIPHRIVVSPRLLADGVLEYKARKQPEKQRIDKTAMADFLIETIKPDDR
jgi:prolyl-tRNA synthetase